MKKLLLIFILLIPYVSATDYVYLSMNGESIGETVKLDIQTNQQYVFKGSGTSNITTVYIYVKGEDNLVQGLTPTLIWTPKEEKIYELDIIGWVSEERVTSQKFYLNASGEEVKEDLPCSEIEDFFDKCACLEEKLTTAIYPVEDYRIKIGFTESESLFPGGYYRNGIRSTDFAVIYNTQTDLANLYLGLDADKEVINSKIDANNDKLRKAFHNDACSGFWTLLQVFGNEEVIVDGPPEDIPNKEGSCVSIKYNGEETELIDIVFLAENYDSIDEFREDLNYIIEDGMFYHYVLGKWEDKFNIWYIDKNFEGICSESNSSDSCSVAKLQNNAAECPYDAAILLSKVRFRSHAFFNGKAFISTGFLNPENNKDVYVNKVVHELGHAIFNLDDEYVEEGKKVSQAPQGPNCYADKNLAREKWRSYGLVEGIDFNFFNGCYYQQEFFRGVECTVMGPSKGCSWAPNLGNVNSAYIENEYFGVIS